VVKLYERYKDQGFEILGVSLDRKKDGWLQAIEADGLTWPHVSDLKGWQNEAAKLYGVSSIPDTLLIDREGKIVARKLRGPALEKAVAELMGE
jgi:peroxiredoxin